MPARVLYHSSRLKRLIPLLLVFVCAPIAAWGQTGITEGPHVTGPTAAEIQHGELEFRLYCSQCHGMEGTGNGPVARALRTPPANLRILTQKNGGVFPEQEIRDFVDGTKQMASHGDREMPIWGLAFQYRGSANGDLHAPPAASRLEVNRRIDLLVDYIRSIQSN